jgi:molybdate ABC transporter permease protein
LIPDLSPLATSLKTAGIATLLAGLGGVLCARAVPKFASRSRFLLETLILIPMVLPPTVIGYGLLFVFGPHGPVGYMTNTLWGEILIFTWWAGMLASSIVAFPVVYLSARGAFEQVDGQLLDAARTFGAGSGRLLFDILLPLARPGLIAGLLLALARSLGEFGATMMVAGRISDSTETIPMAIYFAVEAGEEFEALFWSSVAISIACLVLAVSQRMSRRRVT